MITTMRFTIPTPTKPGVGVSIAGVTYEGAIRFIESSRDGSWAFMAGTFSRNSDGPHPFTAKLLGEDMAWPR